MATYRVHKNKNYTIMSNYHLRDKNLSMRAKGLLSVMLSLPEDWDYSINGLASISQEGVKAIRTILKEMEKAGYLVRTRISGEGGRFDYIYDLYEHPIEVPQEDVPDVPSPYDREGHAVEGHAEDAIQLSKDEPSTDLRKTETNSSKEKDLKEIENDKRALPPLEPNILTKVLIDKGYISKDDPHIDKYNRLTEELIRLYDYEQVRACVWYFAKLGKTHDEYGNKIYNKTNYFETSIRWALERQNRDWDWESNAEELMKRAMYENSAF